ncbi:MAG TPA: isoaspartyl peptidase/L-asparaginase [Nitrososphaera sp.]|jgi:beta-aspartyl-peptidase (threonine type)
MAPNFGIMIHGGAGTSKIGTKETQISKALQDSVCTGYDILLASRDAIESVESAVASMEDSGVFNAGAGSCLTLEKRMEMDASIMDGRDLRAGSVGAVEHIKNPVKLARKVMERTDHAMFVSSGASKLAELCGIAPFSHEPTKEKLDAFAVLRKKLKTTWPRNYRLSPSANLNQKHFGTVGAVAIDKHANVAAAVSTGGRWLKMHGRVGDSAVIGAGIYADNSSGAACATGNGELIMRLCLSKYACDLMKQRHSPSQAARKAISLATRRFGPNNAGIMAVNAKGMFSHSMNTRSMRVAMKTSKDHGKMHVRF